MSGEAEAAGETATASLDHASLRGGAFRVAWKDSYSAILSSLALIISGTSAYYSLFRVNLDAKLLIAEGNYPSCGENAGSITSIDWDVGLTFINNGNRPYSVQNVELESFSVRQLDDKLADCRPLSEGGGVILGGIITRPDPKSFAPTVVEPGKIVIVHPSFADDPSKQPPAVALALVEAGAPAKVPPTKKAPKPEPVSLIKAALPGGVINLVSCLRVNLVDHEGHQHMVSKPVYFARRVTAGSNEGEGEGNQSIFIDAPIDLSALLAQRDVSKPARTP